MLVAQEALAVLVIWQISLAVEAAAFWILSIIFWAMLAV
jgi:hypothetical protein